MAVRAAGRMRLRMAPWTPRTAGRFHARAECGTCVEKGLDNEPIFLSMSSGLRARADRARAPRSRVRSRPDAHSVAQGSAVSLDVLDGVDMIAWHKRWRAQAALEEAWRVRGITPRIVYRSDDSLMIQRLVAAGLGWACLGALSVQQLIGSELRRIAIRDELPPRTLVLCHARDRQLTPAASILIDAVRAVANPSRVADQPVGSLAI